MCGIAGIVVCKGKQVENMRISAMASSLSHRGPDDEGIWSYGQVGLAHRRLSILDLSSQGHQPMTNADGSLCIVFNGEIYNFKELRKEIGDEASFKSSTDTEVLLRAYEKWGESCLTKLNGMFAFAIFDNKKNRLFLARDRLGIKPLYFAKTEDCFMFASEAKAMIAAGLPRELNHLAVIDFAFSGEPMDDRDFIKHVKRLGQGTYLVLDLNSLNYKKTNYYALHPELSYHKELGMDEQLWSNRLEELLVSSVDLQLVADVPVGTYCSGGIDSSLLTAIAAKKHPNIIAFNVSFPDTQDDESPYAECVAKHLGIELNTLKMSQNAFIEAFVQSVFITEYPLQFINSVPLFLVSQLARDRGVPVLLSGEGADESYGGYVNLYKMNAIHRIAREHGKIAYWAFCKALEAHNKIARKLKLSTWQLEPTVGTEFHDLLVGTSRRSTILEESRAIYDGYYRDPLDLNLAAELLSQFRTYLPGILHRTDRASMAASVEARVPFLDHRMVEFALSVPLEFKCKTSKFRLNVEGKSILKKLACKYVPSKIVYRPKCGFGIPKSYYSIDWPRQWINEGFIVSQFDVEPSRLQWWIKANEEDSLCRMLALEVWGQLFIWNRPVSTVQEELTEVLS